MTILVLDCKAECRWANHGPGRICQKGLRPKFYHAPGGRSFFFRANCEKFAPKKK